MRIRVRYLGFIKDLTGREWEELVFDEGCEIREVLDKVAEKYGEKFQKEIYEPGMKDLKSGFVLAVNGILMGQLKGVETPLKDGDELVFMSLAIGG